MENQIIFFDGSLCHIFNEEMTLAPERGLWLKVDAAGLCGTDLQILRGIRQESSSILGHEGIARVVQDYRWGDCFFKRGQRVLINPTDKLNSNFLLGHNVSGLFQQYLCIPPFAINDGVVIPVDYSLPNESAALIEPIAVALHAIKSINIFSPRSFVIFGGGIIGNLLGILLRIFYGGSIPVLLVHHTWNSRSDSGKDIVADITHSLYQQPEVTEQLHMSGNAVFIVTPRNATNNVLDMVLRTIGSESVINVIGGIDENKSILNYPASLFSSIRAGNISIPVEDQRYESIDRYLVGINTNRNIFLTGQRGVTNQEFLESIDLLKLHYNSLAKMITHRFCLNDFCVFLNQMIHGNERIIHGKYVLKAALLMD
ncbi:hypothetical protein CWC46_03960 [Prodigiosinella confusarubida]|uniref:Alcohol dehydrogenase-like N-terminal domain-containing protein n=1 Tax=Serratia sp. (strain ATCC 39006) TaxID=104623 RepID=A0A2I5TFM3_SERS3|nr:alcohol dehydrogenase catalytic domain-containing protein [Serratia sp. ATCC 39006]AUG99045.1 hypothetical protein CWC46_03960 [Serratia sp. ATCC 39006]AUH03360.1 hypothetical protein Ser39006_003960 [Serratia sp. ATCC 39006]